METDQAASARSDAGFIPPAAAVNSIDLSDMSRERQPRNRLIKPFLCALVSVVLALSAAFHNFRFINATPDGLFSDHFSHMDATPMFLAKGLEVYRKPVDELLERSKDLDFAKRNGLGTAELFVNPLNPNAPPIAIGWSHEIRAYPPGLYALYFPLAVLYQFKWVGFQWACRIAVLCFVFASGCTAFVLFRLAFASEDAWSWAIRMLTAVGVTFWSYFWALRGFYDVIPNLLTILSLRALARRKWTEAILFFWLAACLHWRALYALPIVLLATVGGVKEQGLKFCVGLARDPKAWISAGAAIASIGCLAIALPQIRQFAGNNIFLQFGETSIDETAATVALILAASCVIIMLYAADYAGLLFLAVPWLFLLRTPQVYAWHTLFWLPMLMWCTFNLRTPIRRFVWLNALFMIVFMIRNVYYPGLFLSPAGLNSIF